MARTISSRLEKLERRHTGPVVLQWVELEDLERILAAPPDTYTQRELRRMGIIRLQWPEPEGDNVT